MLKPIVTDTYDFPTLIKRRSDEFSSRAQQLAVLLSSDLATESSLRNILTAVFAMAPHEWKLKDEAEAKRYFLLFMRMAGATINAEVESANGRADAILETAKACYVFEFKHGKSARAALKQCRAIAHHPGCRRRDICESLRMSPRTLDRQIATLVATRRIEFRGAPKNGGYFILPIPCDP